MNEPFDIQKMFAAAWSQMTKFQRRRIVQVVGELKQPPWPAETYTNVMNSVGHISGMTGPHLNGLILEVYEKRLT